MSWFKSGLTTTLFSVFSPARRPAAEPTGALYDVEDIRAAMLALIGGARQERFMSVARRIRYAEDVTALWFLRGDLMLALASGYGEEQALEQMEDITQMFEALLPSGLRSRPSPLGAR